MAFHDHPPHRRLSSIVNHLVSAKTNAIPDWRTSSTMPFYASPLSYYPSTDDIPDRGYPARHCLLEIQDQHSLDFSQKLNTSSYVNVIQEPEEEQVAVMGLKINLADQTVYPQSFKVHNRCVTAIAKLWNCPEPNDFGSSGTYAGAGTVGSTEGCLLAGLALKFRWREWYRKKHGQSAEQVIGVRPNLIISTLYQAAWEKLFKYMDIVPKFVKCSSTTFKIDPTQVADLMDEQTIGVVCVLGNHYGGQYDAVNEVNKVVEKANKDKNLQVGIHVDAASGGFVAPFQDGMPEWDFRLKNVLSISSSGHKFGEACCGTGWVVWRQREGLSEHVAINVSYLGGSADSYTLNFSRPASGVYTQWYKFLRLGKEGYKSMTNNMMLVSAYIRKELRAMTTKDGKLPMFQLLDDGDSNCLPVVAAMINPQANTPYDDIDLQYAMSRTRWYVGGYCMNYEHPLTKKKLALFEDQSLEKTMFRVVVKSNLTMRMAQHLIESFRDSIIFLDSHGAGYKKYHEAVNPQDGHGSC